MFTKITKVKQELYETSDEKNYIPELCGVHGRACRQMEDKADRMLCNGCSLKDYSEKIDAICVEIKNVCDRKESIGIEKLYDSDIYDIQDALERNGKHVSFLEIERVLNKMMESEA